MCHYYFHQIAWGCETIAPWSYLLQDMTPIRASFYFDQQNGEILFEMEEKFGAFASMSLSGILIHSTIHGKPEKYSNLFKTYRTPQWAHLVTKGVSHWSDYLHHEVPSLTICP